MYLIDLEAQPKDLRAALADCIADRTDRLTRASAPGAIPLAFRPLPSETRHAAVERSDAGLTVRYARRADAFRALGRLLGGDTGPFAETSPFQTLGVMVDCSRNGVLRPDTARFLMRRLALMGFDACMLYLEDTYEVDGEPYFGYMRGAYSFPELAALDAYADLLGLEMFACVETLAHLEQILQWPHFQRMQDVPGVLLVDDERANALLAGMIHAASAPFRSRRIHVGLDEASGLGNGRYKALHGVQDPFDVFLRHLDRLRGICQRLGLQPLMWSDMYFRMGSKDNAYYDRASVIPPAVIARIPHDVGLVYWDYYHTDADFYEAWIDRHRALGVEPIFAGGVWTWNRLWAALPFSNTATGAAMTACRRKGVRQAFACLWGDDGAECDLMSALPGLQRFAEHAWADAIDETRLRAHFRGSCDADYDAFVRASAIDTIPIGDDGSRGTSNVGKALLWEDPMLGILDASLDDATMPEQYAALAKALDLPAQRKSLDRRLAFPAQVARVLSLKTDLHHTLGRAYRAANRGALRRVAAALPTLRREVDRLWRIHRALWLATCKPFGLEVLEARYGALRTRLETVQERLTDYLEGRIDALAELEKPPQKIYVAPGERFPDLDYARVKTPSVIK